MTPSSPPSILVVDDQLENLKLLASFLTLHHYEVRAVTSGKAALNTVQAMPPDLILLDIMMPDLDGYQVCQILKQDPLTREIPVLFISAITETADKVKAFEVGGVDYVTKPFQMTEVLARVKTHLVLSRQRKDIAVLQRLNLLKDIFVSTISHELRTPLTNMRMALQMLALAPLPEKFQRYRQILETECQHEIELIEDLLKLQEQETLIFNRQRQTIVIADWLPPLLQQLQPSFAQQHIHLQTSMTEPLPLLATDPFYLNRSLTELLLNACYHTAVGESVQLHVFSLSEAELSTLFPPLQREGEVQSRGGICFRISNPGEIPTEEIPYIFDKFHRIPKKDLWQNRGMGLGLAVVKHLIREMEGAIGVGCREGWVHFAIWIPLTTSVSEASVG
ncbi:MAG: hybrid sensor histidine kinase/response regulator [Synechococcaceae cyanobacterium SM2_3_1]|nr:hybrid sensor histidine kinase/response regulator [Synechococcaceae cyanobacterium SM2_3_1]